MQVINTERVPIFMWGRDFEEGAMEQARNIANLPFAFHHTCMMPDSHLGKGCHIGAVAALKDVVSINFVGVDIGCGMSAVKTSLTEIAKDDIKKIMGTIRELIPVGMNRHKKEKQIKREDLPNFDQISERNLPVVWENEQNAIESLGTLGGGKCLLPAQEYNLNILKSLLIDLEYLLR